MITLNRGITFNVVLTNTTIYHTLILIFLTKNLSGFLRVMYHPSTVIKFRAQLILGYESLRAKKLQTGPVGAHAVGVD